MTAFGLQADALPEPHHLAVWSENWGALQVLRRMLTQLNMAPMGGVIGLRYEALPIVLRSCQIPRAELSELMDCLQYMERHLVKLLNAKG